MTAEDSWDWIDGMLDALYPVKEAVRVTGADYDQRKIKAKAKLQAALIKEKLATLKDVAAHNNSEYTSDYLEEQISALQEQLKGVE